MPADIQDRDAALDVFEVAQVTQSQLELIWADGAYQGGLEDRVAERYPWRLIIVNKLTDQQGFVVLHRRWVVETTPPDYP